MNDVPYDVPISEVAKMLDKSDRQVRRYVKDRKIEARPVRIEGHVKLMFNRDEIMAFRANFSDAGIFGASGREIIVNAGLLNDGEGGNGQDVRTAQPDVDDTTVVRYALDALREQLTALQEQNRELHYQLEQRSGQVGFLQGKVEILEEEMKMLMPASPAQEEIIARKPWYKRLFGRA